METTPSVISARVSHTRHKPIANSFAYGVDYLLLDEASLTGGPTPSLFGYDRPALVTLRTCDHGLNSGSGPAWVHQIACKAGIEGVHDVSLLAHPRYWGYNFNPVSFWFMLGKDGALRGVLSEVHNTFGERHGYLCADESGNDIPGDRWISSRKQFHVSPFFDIEGDYRFRFSIDDHRIGVWINYDDGQGGGLATSLVGQRRPFTNRELARALLRRPFGALRVSALIHKQAIGLFAKGVRYRQRPEPRKHDLT